MLASVCFTTANLLIGSLSELGMRACFYFCSGSLVFSAGYFIYQKEWSKLNIPEQQAMAEQRKVLLRTWDNKFDWFALLIVLGGSVI